MQRFKRLVLMKKMILKLLINFVTLLPYSRRSSGWIDRLIIEMEDQRDAKRLNERREGRDQI
jgi:hypothetical protein